MKEVTTSACYTLFNKNIKYFALVVILFLTNCSNTYTFNQNYVELSPFNKKEFKKKQKGVNIFPHRE